MFVIWIASLKYKGFFNGCIDETDGFIGTSKDLLGGRILKAEQVKIVTDYLDKRKIAYKVLQYIN